MVLYQIRRACLQPQTAGAQEPAALADWAQPLAVLLQSGTHLGVMGVQSTACALPSASVRTRAASSWAAAGCRIRRSRAVRRIHRLRACAVRGCAPLNKGWSLVCCFPPRRRCGRRHRRKGSVCNGMGASGPTGAPHVCPWRAVACRGVVQGERAWRGSAGPQPGETRPSSGRATLPATPEGFWNAGRLAGAREATHRARVCVACRLALLCFRL